MAIIPAPIDAITVVGEHRRVWCFDCHSTSRVEANLYQVTTEGVTWVRVLTHCPRCRPVDRDRPA